MLVGSTSTDPQGSDAPCNVRTVAADGCISNDWVRPAYAT
jgi:hypothetical protein